jgi:hypothetical protein
MTDQEKEFESIDDLFRRSFDNLPVSPDPNGWDSPSAQVWTQVQDRIKTPKSEWSAQQLWMISAFAVAVAVALYWAFVAGRTELPKPAETPAAQPALETPATPDAPVPVSGETAGFDIHKRDQPVKKARKTLPGSPAVRFNSGKTQTSDIETALPLPDAPKKDEKQPLRPEASAPLPGSDIDYHNSTEWERAERAKKPLLQPLPAYRKKIDPPPAPEFLQKLRKG